MVALLALHLTLAAGPAPDGPPRAARLLSQADAPSLLVPDERSSREAALVAEVAALDARIKAINVNWPTGAVIAAYSGGIVVYAVLLTLVAVVTSLSTPAPLIVLVALGVAGAGLLIAGLVAGMNAAAAARLDRDALIHERERLGRELAELRARPDVVLGPPGAPSPTLTLARF